MEKVYTDRTFGTLGGKYDLNAKVWPNGEAVVWRPRTIKLEKTDKYVSSDMSAYKMAALRTAILLPGVLEAVGCPLGLSILAILHNSQNAPSPSDETDLESRKRKGLNGITSYGRRMVRNAAYLLESEHGRYRCIFATVTIPPLPPEQMRILHERWHQLVKNYRLGIIRKLQAQGLTGEIVTVAEVQEKRYEVTGLPVLHLHSVFCGVDRSGKYVLTPESHDDIWFRALQSVVDIERSDCTAACNLQRVKKSAAGYLGKYMSKGCSVVRAIAEAGLDAWLPKHWWGCSRSLATRVKGKTRIVNELADWLNSAANSACDLVWSWHREVSLECDDGSSYAVAIYGRLTDKVREQIMSG